jgi:hypothetical protein
MIWGVSGSFVAARMLMENWPNGSHYRTSSLNKVASEFFRTIAPDPLHWTQNSCFGCFEPFRYCPKVDAKLAKLVPLTHKFAKQSHVRIFRNERTRSTPLDPKLMFWVFRTVSCLHESRCKTGQTGGIIAQVRYANSRRNFS